ncbi:adenylate kinase [uncultured Duncaniella sp.]|uniref:adenylate kinase n=1 Tax=uncultured Duncaniella sp. TaxID=2768039 RepID=UPI002597796E|nr:adenylate kinase [uncultured Duncaniella sp.]
MFNLVIFGAPGSGKGTQSEKLIDRYGLTHISTGDVLRKEIAAGSELGKIADSYISKGQLIPDELMVDILASEVDRLRPQSKGFIFDGFPRTIPQAEALKKMLEERGEEVHSVIGLEVADEELMERLIKRGAESGRSDDNPETIGNRLKVYHSTTSPLRDYYTAEGTYRAIQGSGRVDEIFSRITEAIESQAVLN